MEEKGFIAFVFRSLLASDFKDKSTMARTLGIQLRTLQANFQNLDRAKGATIAFEKLVYYCASNGIELTALYRQYEESQKKGAIISPANRIKRIQGPTCLRWPHVAIWLSRLSNN